MTDDHRESRLADSSALLARIASLEKVKGDYRLLLLHDELAHAIERSVKKHGGAKALFTTAQVNAIKDIIFHVVYVLDHANRPRGLFPALRAEWQSLSPMKKISTVFAVLAVFAGAGVGAFHLAKEIWSPAVPTASAPAGITFPAPTPTAPATQPAPNKPSK